MRMTTGGLFVCAAAYDSETDARADLAAFQITADNGSVGKYDTALIWREGDKVHVEKHGTPTVAGIWGGALAGGVVGLLFPPAIIGGALAGAAAGAVAGRLWGGMSRSDLKDLGELLDAGEWGLVIVGHSMIGDSMSSQLKRALRAADKRVAVDARELEKLLRKPES